MRKLVASLAWLLGVATVAFNATAIPPVLPQPTGTPGPTTPPPSSGGTVRVVGFTNLTPTTPSTPYRGGPVEISVELENIGSAVATTKVRLAHPGLSVEQAVDVPPKVAGVSGKASAKFTDAGGVDESCGPHTYSITLEGTSVDTRTRRASLVPTCSWAARVEDAWARGIPDGAKAKAYFATVDVVDSPIICAAGVRLTTTVTNHSAKGSPALTVRATAGGVVKTQSSAFTLAPGGSATATLGVGGGIPQDLELTLVDPNNIFTPEIANRRVIVSFQRACRLAATQVSF